MRAYRVSTTFSPKTSESTTTTVVRFAGTNALARDQRQAFVNDYGVKKSTVEIEEVEIPTAKADLIDFINALIA